MECIECGGVVDPPAVYASFSELIDRINEDDDFKFSEREEAVYHMCLCVSCASK